MINFLKMFFEDEDSIVGLYRFKGKFASVRVKSDDCSNTKYGFSKIETQFFESHYKCNNFKLNLKDNTLLF